MYNLIIKMIIALTLVGYIFLKLINNSCIYKPIRIRQFGQVHVV